MNKLKQRRKRGVVLSFKGLEKLQEARLKSEYEENFGERYTYEKISELTNLDINTIKKVLNAKEGVDKRSLECFFLAFELKLTPEDYRKPDPNKRQDWGEAICISDFYGRTEEIDCLEQWLLKDKCRLITILGMGGIGKTSISIKLAQQIQDKFDCVVWRSLRDAPPLKELLGNIIEFLSEEQVTEADLPESVGGRITVFIDYLRSLRCLVIFDNLESLLCSNGKAGFCREGYEEYGELFRRIGETKHQSSLLVTTREKPKQVAALEGETLPVRTFKLQGLPKEEGEKILQRKGLDGSESEVAKLVRHYDGNALALKVVATTIRDLFDGDIKEFLREQTSIFGDVRHLLDRQFERLSALEQEIIYWLAINREPITLFELREDLVITIPRMNLMEGLESLSRRSLVEQNEACFTLQSVVMEYVTCCLIEKVCQEVNTKKLKLFRCYALMKATAKDYVRETQIRLILQPVIEGLLALFRCEEKVEEQLTQILAIQQETSPRESGYTAGNIINLLCQMEVDLKGYDFSNLCVWQADLRNTILHEVNFSHSDLSKTLFAEAFGGIWSVAFSPDGEILASGDTKGEIILRRVSDGQPIRSFKEHKGWVVSLDFSPDGKTLASSSCDCTAKLWDVNSGQCLHTLQEHEHEVWSVAFSPDGETLATGCDDGKARLWNISTGECLKVFQDRTNYILSVAFSLNGRKLLSGSHDGIVRLWDIETEECQKVFKEHNNGVRAIAVSLDGQIFASSGNDCMIRLWNIETGECLKVFQGHSNGVWSVIFCSDNILASGSIDHTVRLWDVDTGECLKVFRGHYNWINSVAFCQQKNILVSGSYDQTVKLWNIDTHKCFKTLQGYSNQALSTIFSPDGQILASGGHDQKIRLWNINTGRILETLHEHTNWVWSVAFNPQGNLLASGSGDKNVKLWDVSTGKVIKTFQGHQTVVRSVAFRSDNQILASGSEDQTVRLWNIKTGQIVKILQGHQAEIWSIAFSPDGQVLVSGSLDGTVKLWNVESGKCLKTLNEHSAWIYSVDFSPNNKTVATTSPDQSIRLWNVSTGECEIILQEDKGYSQVVAFSRDGQTIASCNQNNNIKLWNINTGECFKILQGHKALVNSLTFCPDNCTLVSSSEDETIKLWNIKSGECIKVLKIDKPYEKLKITETRGLTEATSDILKVLGAISSLSNVSLKIQVAN